MPIRTAACRAALGGLLALFAADHARAEAAPPSSVSAAGFTLTSISVDLPAGERAFPAGPGVEVVQQSCTACHSVGMVMSQPALLTAAWEGEVNKMRAVYKAPVDAADVPVIVAYLASVKGVH